MPAGFSGSSEFDGGKKDFPRARPSLKSILTLFFIVFLLSAIVFFIGRDSTDSGKTPSDTDGDAGRPDGFRSLEERMADCLGGGEKLYGLCLNAAGQNPGISEFCGTVNYSSSDAKYACLAWTSQDSVNCGRIADPDASFMCEQIFGEKTTKEVLIGKDELILEICIQGPDSARRNVCVNSVNIMYDIMYERCTGAGYTSSGCLASAVQLCAFMESYGIDCDAGRSKELFSSFTAGNISASEFSESMGLSTVM